MDASTIQELLHRGSLETVRSEVPRYSALVDPIGADELGRELAGRVRSLEPTAVLVWESAEDAVLGYIVGRELGIPVVRSFDEDGLLGTSTGVPERPRLLLVSDAIRDQRAVLAAKAIADRGAGTVVGTAVLRDTVTLRELGGVAATIVALVPPP
jgi:hypothetical protein